MEEMDAAINAATSPTVKIWMNWMLLIFAASVFFVWNHKTAWVIIPVLILSAPVAVYIYKITQSVPLIGIAHIIFWPPLVAFLYFTEIKGKPGQLKTPYGIYIVLLLTTITISLLFDIRDAIIFLPGVL